MSARRMSPIEQYIRRRVRCANLLPVTAAEWDALLAEAMSPRESRTLTLTQRVRS